MRPRVITFLLLALAATLIGASFAVPVDQIEGGGRTLQGWWLAMVGVSIAVGALVGRLAGSMPGMLAALFALGTAAQLSLIRPLWLISIRVPPIEFTERAHFAAAAVIAVQALIVAGLSWRRAAAMGRTVLGLLTPLRAAVLAFLFVPCAAHVAVFYPGILSNAYFLKVYAASVGTVGALFALNLLHLIAIAGSIPAPRLERGWRSLQQAVSLPGSEREPTGLDRRLPWAVATFVLVAAIVLGVGVFQGVPHIPDESAYLFQAKMLANGMLEGPAPPNADSFQLYLLAVEGDRWYVVNHPGWPTMLALGLLLGAPWIINPLFGAASILIAHALTRRLTDCGTAHGVILLLATSPWFLVLSAAYQPHAATLFMALAGWWLLTEARRQGAWWAAFLAGLAAGVVFTIRPLDALILGTLTGLLFLLPEWRRIAWAQGFSYAAGCVATGSFMLAFNYRFTGRLTEFPINKYLDVYWDAPGANRIGFGPDVGQLWAVLDPIPGHGWRDVLLNTNQNMVNLNFEFLGWGVGSLLLVAVHLLWGRWSKVDRAAGFFVAAVGCVYNLYWFSGGPDYGPRYWYLMIYPLIFLSARGAVTLADILADRVELAKPRVAASACVMMLTALVVFMPWRSVSKYVDYRDQHREFRYLAEAEAFGSNGLVAVETDLQEEYASAFYLNDIIPGSTGPVYVRYRDCATLRRDAQAFPGRPVFHVTSQLSDGKRHIRVVEVPTPVTCGGAAENDGAGDAHP